MVRGLVHMAPGSRALQRALGVAAPRAGLGVVCTVMGVAFIWDTRRKSKISAPDTIPEALLADTSAKTAQTV